MGMELTNNLQPRVIPRNTRKLPRPQPPQHTLALLEARPCMRATHQVLPSGSIESRVGGEIPRAHEEYVARAQRNAALGQDGFEVGDCDGVRG
jgi:hypothetical protein